MLDGRLRKRITTTACVALALVVALPLEVSAHHDEVVDKLERGTTELVSVSSSGEQGDGHSFCGSSSDNGRYVAFKSEAGNLHAADLNGKAITDLFVYDRKNMQLDLVTALPTGLAPELPLGLGPGVLLDPVGCPAISANGRYVAFSHQLPLTAVNDPDSTAQTIAYKVYVRDLKRGKTELVSRAPDGMVAANHQAIVPSISKNGRYVAFVSRDPDLGLQAYVRDRKARKTILVSKSSTGEPANAGGSNNSVQISGNGRYAVFESKADNLTPDADHGCRLGLRMRQGPTDPNCNNVFLHDLRIGETELISKPRDDESIDDGRADGRWLSSSWSATPATISGGYLTNVQGVSNDGRFVLFLSAAGDLVPNNPPRTSDLFSQFGQSITFVRDRKTGRTERVSVSSTGSMIPSNFASMTADGRYVYDIRTTCQYGPGPYPPPLATSFDCLGHNTSGGYLHDRKTGQLDWVIYHSIVDRPGSGCEGPIGGGCEHYVAGGACISWDSYIGATGRFIVGTSPTGCDKNVEGDTNAFSDVFVRDIGVRGLGVGEVKSGSSQRQLSVAGDSVFGKTGILELTDAADDAAAPLEGAEIIGATVAHRPDLSDLFVTIDVDRLPVVTSLGLVTIPVLYGVRFETPQATYEMRAQAVGSVANATFGLFRCTGDTCTEVAKVEGGYGTIGENVVAAIPLEQLGLEDGGRLDQVEVFSALGTYVSGVSRVLDEARLLP